MPRDDEDAIRQRAYEIWEREGRPDGSHIHHWDRATLEVEEERSKLLQSDPDPLRDGDVSVAEPVDPPPGEPGDLAAPPALASMGLTSMGVPSAGPSPLPDVAAPAATGRGKPKRSG